MGQLTVGSNPTPSAPAVLAARPRVPRAHSVPLRRGPIGADGGNRPRRAGDTGPMAPMTPEQVRSFLGAGTRSAKLATVRADGRPHVVPVWFVLDGHDAVFTTGAESVKGRARRRDPRVALCVDDERPPYAFVTVTGEASLSTDLDELLRFATKIGGSVHGGGPGQDFGRRNAVPGELLVRVTRATVVADTDVAA